MQPVVRDRTVLPANFKKRRREIDVVSMRNGSILYGNFGETENHIQYKRPRPFYQGISPVSNLDDVDTCVLGKNDA